MAGVQLQACGSSHVSTAAVHSLVKAILGVAKLVEAVPVWRAAHASNQVTQQK